MTIDKQELETWLVTEEGKQWLNPKIDHAVSKGINTFKEKTLPSLISEEIAKANPTDTPEQKRLKQIENDLTQERKLRTKEILKTKVVTKFAEAGISTDIADFVIADDEESTNANVTRVTEVWKSALEKAVSKQLGTNGRLPQNNVLDMKTIDDQIKAAYDNRNVSELIRLKNLKLNQK